MASEEMLKRSVIIAAHPDDELLWFAAILKQVDRVVMIYEDYWPKPEVGEARAAVLSDYPRDNVISLQIPEAATHSCADWDNPKLTEFGIDLGNEATFRDAKQSVKKLLGRGAAPAGGIKRNYEANSRELYDKLKPMLTPDMNVFTHNPWGEYGHEDHLQVFRVVDRLRRELGFKLWMTNYCTDRALPLAMTYFNGGNRDFVQLPVDREYADMVASVYRRHGCWTWADDWQWFPFELYSEAPSAQSAADSRSHLLPLNMFRFGT